MGVTAAYLFPKTISSGSDRIDFGSFDNPFVGSQSLCCGCMFHLLGEGPAGDSRLMSKQSSGAATNHEFMLGILTANNQIRIRLKSGGTSQTLLSANNAYALNTSHRVAITYDGATIRLWVDGAEHVGGNFPWSRTGDLNAVSGSELWIGSGAPLGGTNMNGYVAEAFIDRLWEPERLKEWGRGELLGNLLKAPFFWLNGDEPGNWAAEGRGADKTIANAARHYGGVPRTGFVEQDVHSAMMPGIDRRAFVQVTFPNYPVLDTGIAGAALLQVIGETAQGAEGRASPQALARILTEMVHAGELKIPVRTLARAQAEAADTAETVVNSLAAIIVRAAAEALQATESLARTLGLTRARAGSAQTAEASKRARSLTRPVAERADNSEGALGSRMLARLATEISEGMELRLRALGLTRSVGEMANPTEAVAQVENFAEGAKMVIKLVGQVALATPLAALRRTVISLTGKIGN